MKCEVCGLAERAEQLIRYSVSIEDRFVVVDHVPAEVCPRCGEVTLLPEVVDRLRQTIQGGGTVARRMEVPVYELTG